MDKKPNQKLIYFITALSILFTMIVVIEGWNYHQESIEHDSGPINRILNWGKIDDAETRLTHTKRGIVTGYISIVNENSMTVSKNRLQWGITADNYTKVRYGNAAIQYSDLHVNDSVTIFGEELPNSTIVKAVLIRKN